VTVRPMLETGTRESRSRPMHTAVRALLVLGISGALLNACSPPPQVSRTTPTPAASGSPSTQSAIVAGGWSAGGNLSTQRGEQMIGALLDGGRVLVTGISSDGLGVGNVDIYDPANGWSLGPNLATERRGAVAAALPGGGALIAGGAVNFQGDTIGPGPLATAVTYKPATGTWVTSPNMAVARGEATATALPDGRVLVTGGYDWQVIQLTDPPRQAAKFLPQSGSQFFNPTSSAWTAAPSLAQGRFAHSAALLTGGRVLVVGGADQMNPERLLDSAELFDPAAGRWLSAGSISAPRKQFTLTALADGRALVAGGLAADGSTVLRSTLIYDPTTNQWVPGPDLTNARTGHAAAILTDGRVLVTGGADQAGRLASSELFDPSAGSWSATGGLATARSNHLAISLPTGRILVVGGSGPSDSLASSELFDPSAKGRAAGPRVPAGPGHWQLGATKPIPTDSYTGSAQLLPDGRVVVIPAHDSADFQVYDPKLDTWTTPFSRRTPPCNACGIGYSGPYPPFFLATALGNGMVLLLTVDPQKVIATKAEVVDLNTGQATAAASPGTIELSRLVLLPDGRVWLTALQHGDRHAKLYDPSADRWTTTSDVPPDLTGINSDFHTVTAVPGHRVLVTGPRKTMVYDPASGAWSDAGSFPSDWSYFSATGLRTGDVLLAGGTVLTGTTPGGAPISAATSQVMRWDHTTGQIRRAESMPVGLYDQSATLLADGRVLLAGGADAIGVHNSADPVTRAEIYDPVALSWSIAAPLPVARWEAIAITLADGRVLLVGGSGMWLGASLPSEGQPSLLFTPGS